ncbi:MAG: deiodinase family protein, partial [Gemmataceae bacterium]|nr:deiodinase family protein [Gemmataceae bacterium]
TQFGYLEQLHQAHKEKAAFLGVYIREAHASDGWWPIIDKKAGVDVKQPRSTDERCAVAATCSTALKMTMPLLVDKIDDAVGLAYSGMPDRLYVIGKDGRVAYKGGRGPFGFRPAEMEQVLLLLELEEHLAKAAR